MLVYDLKNTLDRNENIVNIYFDIGFVTVLGIHICSFMCSVTAISKLCDPNVRGTMFALNGFVGSLFILTL